MLQNICKYSAQIQFGQKERGTSLGFLLWESWEMYFWHWRKCIPCVIRILSLGSHNNYSDI